MISTYGLSHIQLCVRDLDKSRKFYEDLFGMEYVMGNETCVMLRSPGSPEIITLNADPENAHQAGQSAGVSHFGFRLRESYDMQGLLELVRKAGGNPIGHGSRGPEKNELYAFFTDPDGYEVELFYKPN